MSHISFHKNVDPSLHAVELADGSKYNLALKGGDATSKWLTQMEKYIETF